MIHTPLPIAPTTSSKSRFHAVYLLMLALSDRCNLRCSYCFVNKGLRKMTPENARQAIDFHLHRNISGLRPEVAISFFGGEPLIEIDLMELVVAHARARLAGSTRRLRFAATTNGTLAGPRIEKIIRDTAMELLISLDGGEDATTHRPFVNGCSSFAVVAKNLKKLAYWASTAIVRMTFHPGTLDFVGNVTRALELGAPTIVLAPVVEADWAGSEERLEQAYQELADWFISEARRGRILPLESTWILLRQVHAYLQGRGRPGRPCDIATELIAVDPDGNVMPCHRFLYRPQDWLGHVDRPKLSAERDRYLDLRSRDFRHCENCEAKPVCGGGCRSVTLEAGLGFYDTHPNYCLTMRAHARAAYRIYKTLIDEENLHFQRVLQGSPHLGAALTELALH